MVESREKCFEAGPENDKEELITSGDEEALSDHEVANTAKSDDVIEMVQDGGTEESTHRAAENVEIKTRNIPGIKLEVTDAESFGTILGEIVENDDVIDSVLDARNKVEDTKTVSSEEEMPQGETPEEENNKNQAGLDDDIEEMDQNYDVTESAQDGENDRAEQDKDLDFSGDGQEVGDNTADEVGTVHTERSGWVEDLVMQNVGHLMQFMNFGGGGKQEEETVYDTGTGIPDDESELVMDVDDSDKHGEIDIQTDSTWEINIFEQTSSSGNIQTLHRSVSARQSQCTQKDANGDFQDHAITNSLLAYAGLLQLGCMKEPIRCLLFLLTGSVQNIIILIVLKLRVSRILSFNSIDFSPFALSFRSVSEGLVIYIFTGLSFILLTSNNLNRRNQEREYVILINVGGLDHLGQQCVTQERSVMIETFSLYKTI